MDESFNFGRIAFTFDGLHDLTDKEADSRFFTPFNLVNDFLVVRQKTIDDRKKFSFTLSKLRSLASGV